MSKVPEITIAFWITKILATTLGETGGDALSMTLHLGYAVSTGILFALFLVTLFGQVSVKSFHPFRYWAVIVSTTMVGTTMADYLDRTGGLGYIRGSLLLITMLVLILIIWRLAVGKIEFKNITLPKVEVFYWLTILFSNTLGTALGDFTADETGLGLGYEGGALAFGSALALIALAYFKTKLPRTLLFWMAFVLTRPLGATLGDELTKSHAAGGLNFGTIPSSLIIAAVVVALVTMTGQRRKRTEAVKRDNSRN